MNRLKRNKGFTLVEMLACVITLLLLGLTCSAALNMATKSFWRSTFESESQMLESTVDMYIGDILRYSNEIQTDSEGRVTALTNETYRVFGGAIEVTERSGDTGGYFSLRQIPGQAPIMLVSEATYAKTLYIEKLELFYNEQTGIFTGKYIIRSTLLEDEVRECVFSYRRIANL